MKTRNLGFLVAAVLLLATALPATALAAPPAQGEVTYTVKPGDTLWDLAVEYLGSGPAYVDIVHATNDRHTTDPSFAYIESAGRIQAGWKLLIPTTGSAVAGSWTPVQKCETLRILIQQTEDGARAWVQQYVVEKAAVPSQRISPELYDCQDGTTVFAGGVILGPREGWSSTFTVNVPVGGAVQSYKVATYSTTPRKIGEDTYEVISGTVTAVRATVWAFNDRNPPIAVTGIVSTTTGCVDPTALATQRGWTVLEWADKTYGGLRVKLNKQDTLPPLWEALWSGGSIKESDTKRGLPATTITIYPPFACREVLGYSK